jgi:hypothetical protein
MRKPPESLKLVWDGILYPTGRENPTVAEEPSNEDFALPDAAFSL